MIFEIMLDYYSFDYLITIPVDLSSLPAFFAEIWSLKNFSPMVTHTKFTKVPTLTPPFLCCDVNADKVHYVFRSMIIRLLWFLAISTDWLTAWPTDWLPAWWLADKTTLKTRVACKSNHKSQQIFKDLLSM